MRLALGLGLETVYKKELEVVEGFQGRVYLGILATGFRLLFLERLPCMGFAGPAAAFP